MSDSINTIFLLLIRLGLGHQSDALPQNIPWRDIKSLAYKHGLLAIVVDGTEQLPDNYRPPKELLIEWIGEVLQNYEHRYKLYVRTIAEMAHFYNTHGYEMMVLKGYACGLDWSKPEHRPCGDIDIWLFGKQKEADALLVKDKGVIVDASHHHHTVFDWCGFMVENHYDFINVHHHKSNAAFETLLKEQGQDDSYFVEVEGEKVYLPSPNLHALFLLKHACIEFAASGLNLRQLLDWAFFVNEHNREIDWKWLEDLMDRYGMNRLYDIINTICVDDLGFDSTVFPNAHVEHNLKEKVLDEIINPSISNNKPRNLLSRIIWKWHRWEASGWKHKLAYKESMLSAFWSGVWSHILKPSSI